MAGRKEGSEGWFVCPAHVSLPLATNFQTSPSSLVVVCSSVQLLTVALLGRWVAGSWLPASGSLFLSSCFLLFFTQRSLAIYILNLFAPSVKINRALLEKKSY